MKLTSNIKRNLAALAAVLSLAQTVPAAFNPLELTANSFTHDAIVEKTAPPPIGNFATATMDGGTNNTAATFYEQGYVSQWLLTGLPPAGTPFVAAGDPNRMFQTASYTANNALLLYKDRVPSGSLNLVTPASFTGLSVFGATAGAGGGFWIDYTIRYQGGATEVGAIRLFDWYNDELNVAHVANGRVSLNSGGLESINDNRLKLLYADINPQNTAAIVGIDFSSTNTVRAAIFGISGATDSPATVFTPLALTGYNRDMVIEASAPKNGFYLDATTLTMDGTPSNNSGTTWYEKGFNTDWPATGLPVAGTTLTSGDYVFKMPSTYVGNCAAFIGNFAGLQSTTVNVSGAGAFTTLAFLGGTAGGDASVEVVVTHQDGGSEVLSYISFDWHNTTASKFYQCNGKVNPATIGFAEVNSGNKNPNLFKGEITLASSSPVTQLTFNYKTGGKTAIFAVSGRAGSSGAFAPLTLSGFNADPVVEAAIPFPPKGLVTATTATMDRGTQNFQNTWMERGYYNLFPNSGLPAEGSTFASLWKPDHSYRLASYSANNAAYVDAQRTNVNLTPATPGLFTGLSFLSACANGRVTNQCIMQYQDGTSETNNFVSLDWFGGANYAYSTYGRANLSRRTIENDPGRETNPANQNPRLYEAEFPLLNAASPLTNIVLKFLGSQNADGRMMVMAVSATSDPVAPIYASQPVSVRAFEGSNTVVAAVIRGGAMPMTFQWYGNVGGTVQALTDGGVISGATTPSLSFTGITKVYDAAYYLVASNAGGSSTSLTATVSVLLPYPPDVTSAADPVAAYDPVAGSSSGGEEGPYRAFDDTTEKYLHVRGASGTRAVGVIVTPRLGKTTVTAMRIYTANDADGRDPMNYLLEGSNDGGVTFNTIASGALALPTARNGEGQQINPLALNGQEVRFANTAGYLTYRWSCDTVRGSGDTLMQLAEIELLGVRTPEAPVIVQQPPANARVFVGANPTFTVLATGFPTNFTYQWYLNGTTVIPGATSASYTLSNAQLADSGKSFHCVVNNSQGAATSSAATLTVIAAPSGTYPAAIIADTPAAFYRLNEADDASGNTGKPAWDYFGGHSGVYNAVQLDQLGYSANDTDPSGLFGGPFAPELLNSYIGEINGIDFSKPTNSNGAFTVEAWVQGNTQLYDAGIVTKGAGGGGEQFCLDTGAGASKDVRFYVRNAAGNAILANGTNKFDGLWHHVVGVCDQANSNLVLYVDGKISARANMTPLEGILASTHPVSIGSRRPNTATNYTSQFYGNIDEVALYPYALTPAQVLNHYYAAGIAPRMAAEPTNSTYAAGGTAYFYAEAIGTPNLSYQWSSSADSVTFTPIAGATTATLTINNVPASANGLFYRVTVANAYGTVDSAIAQLTVISGPPTVLADVVPMKYVYAGRSFSLSATFVGTVPFTYVWQKNGVNLSNGGRISGANSNVLTVANAQTGDAGNYQLLVSNSQGNGSSSLANVIVEIIPDFNTDGMGWTLQGMDDGFPSPAYITNNVLVLTEGLGGSARSAFFNEPLYVGGFKATFIYQNTVPGADGAAFVIQNSPQGPAALGGAGGALGYEGITPSVALLMNIFGNSGINYGINGARSLPNWISTDPLGFSSGNEIFVTLVYSKGVFSVRFEEPSLARVFEDAAEVDIPAIVGGPTAYVGVTGADGGIASTQLVKNLQYIPLPELTAAQGAPGTVMLSWPAAIGGYTLQSRADLTAGAWAADAAPVTQSGGLNQVTVSATGNQFYRLVLAQ